MTHREQLEARLRELEAEIGAPGFWDDANRARKVTAEHAQISRELR